MLSRHSSREGPVRALRERSRFAGVLTGLGAIKVLYGDVCASNNHTGLRAIATRPYNVCMVAPVPAARQYTHTLSEQFMEDTRRVLRHMQSGVPDWQGAYQTAVAIEFSSDSDLREFCESRIEEILTLAAEGNETLYIHRSLSHGLELFTDD